jgi:hypothetical protein
VGKILVSLAFICFTTATCLAQNDPCDLKRNSQGIKVYTCKTENEKFRLLKAEFTLANISIPELKKFIWDVPNYTTWQYNMTESELLSSSGENEMAYRSLVDAPWPVENRELVLQVKMEEGTPVTRIFIHSFDYKKPSPDDVVRVPFFDASWEVIQQDNLLKVTYTLRIDPGGSVPAWLANLAMAEGPFLSFQKLKQQLEK